MKTLINTVLAATLFSAISFGAFAAQPVTDDSGLVPMGTISIAKADTVADLEAQVQQAAEKDNAKYYKIISAGGDEYIYGNAILYK
ncbi:MULTISPECIES: YdgH/BhsA/McbA-like domain containing protein [Kosakonia]|uniref:MqsR-controlled colanic acid and biofilm protein A n=1 Tax=Kosakonia sacchari TaxID=1158459 RepID=A0A1G4YXQ5_9ENTR|nr:YdgH/BhsA/McbA-like domain containing protein [Kosakonia sacchari]AHJ76834.1 hypothetical protein C813_20550 [Kosakonia sacchari SP1]ANR81181.1 hypothetical protein BBB57_19710 [Kosakonia sacchari]MDN2485476.1 DUF1471 domain-containing protein [Kosakonia sacchari]NUL38190.1 DUF1471 domain-containing protein [Kosakonia sacchari]WOZ78379.1 YdgH/BhsA/McbA-like domain containing protein [Kosakonia sacchari]